MSHRLSIPKKIFYSAIIMVVFFALLEAGARFFEPLPEGRTSAASRRSEGGAFRVLVFGGSTVAGNPVSEFTSAAA